MTRTVSDALAEVERRKLRDGYIEQHVAVLRDEVYRLTELIFQARAALWREWIETGSVAAKESFDRTAP